MNRKVWTTLLCLLIGTLVAYNIIALAFPEQFIMCLTNTTILKIGDFIESRNYLNLIVSFSMTSTIYYLWSVIANRTFKIGKWQWLFIPVATILTYLVACFLSEFGVASNMSIMLLIFAISKENYKPYVLFYIINVISQYMILFVRGYTEALPMMNLGSDMCLSIEGFILALVFSIISVIYRRKEDELQMPTNH